MSDDESRPNLLTIVPGNITIQNFVPGRVYKQTLMIYNTCNVPIIINLKSSDKNKLSLSDSKMRIGVNQAKKLDIIIQDKMNYKYIKSPKIQKKLFIHINGDLIDVKYEINLLYYDKNQSMNNSNRNNSNQNMINNYRFNQYGNEAPNQMMMNNPYYDNQQGFLNENPNNFINKQNINIQNLEYNNQYPSQDFEDYQNQNINIEQNLNEGNKIPYISLEQHNEEIISLKNTINQLNEKVIYLQSLLEENKMEKLHSQNNKYKDDKNLLKISHDSYYIFGSGIEKEIKNKYKIDDNIEIQRILSKNKILELENSTLLYRIKSLEKKLSLYNNINNNIDGEDDNDMIDEDVNLENNIDEENYLNNQNNLVGNNFMNYNKERYKFIYGEGKGENNFNNNININNPFLKIK